MEDKTSNLRRVGPFLLLTIVGVAGPGCSTRPDFRQIRQEGQQAMLDGNYRVARGLLRHGVEMVPEDPANLHDLGDCCMYFSREQFARRNVPAALREVDQAIAYYERAIGADPGYQAALMGKNSALELKGRFEKALDVAEWAAKYVGPSAMQQVFLAREMEERGDLDSAHVRLRQAVAMEPNNADAHEALGRFYHRHGQRKLAIGHLGRAYALDP
ncbi:MAG: tetratricopeptide repeat protein, partial [Phycisphaerae bacterium]